MNGPSVVLILVAGVLAGAGVYLILERSLSRIFIGLGLLTHGVNVLLLAGGGAAGRPPLLGSEDEAAIADPLPQAMMLTAIVLSLGTTAFGLALAYRQWRLTGHDEVVDDIEDRLLAERSLDDFANDEETTGDEDADINYDRDEEDAPDAQDWKQEETR
ncbi:Na(+)/H(+) antiporter subunit C [Schaalia vaccimaxillae]|uniref:Na(+)/H(+) antiporter subunit C n=1 Tax=Schaalia vaccimaxillae TaxID=183916 RepID=UPI0003B5A999|nr:Na(+)/H(+) antiporter subunit C [Schaalia vaccimaxillae]